MKFQIDNKDFVLDDNFLDDTTFTVNSHPMNYKVTWSDSKPNLDLNTFLFMDKNVRDLHFKDLTPPKILVAEATEEFKTPTGVLQLVDFLASNGFTKKDMLLVVGGGIIQDVGAFAGASYKRGIDWTFFPTTSLSMADSCIGGKTGINYGGAKNQLGLFSAPVEVVVNPSFLTTLSKTDLISGLGESLKLYITAGKDALQHYTNNYEKALQLDPNALKALIWGALKIKKVVVEEDEFDEGYRNSLNYGHTVGHAIEVLSDYKISHGQAVVLGILIVNEMSYNRELLNKEDRDLVKKLSLDLLDKETMDILANTDLTDLEDLIKKDKKTKGNVTNFVFIGEIGKTVFVPLELTEELISEIEDIIHKGFK